MDSIFYFFFFLLVAAVCVCNRFSISKAVKLLSILDKESSVNE